MNTPFADAADAGKEPRDAGRVLEEQIAAINAHDAAGSAALYAEDAVVVDPQYSEPLRGRAAVEQDLAAFLTALPDLSVTVTNTLTDGPVLAVEATVAGTNDGPLALPTGEVPATGRRLEFPMAVFSRLDEQGLIVEERRYYDLATQQEQLGLS